MTPRRARPQLLTEAQTLGPAAAGMQEVEVEEDWTDADEADVPLDSAPLDDGLVAQGPGAEFADDALQAKPGSSKRQKKGAASLGCEGRCN